MAEIGIMIEGQEDLTWQRFFRIVDAVEELGFESIFRSDHLTSLDGFSEREALALLPSLTATALRTERIRFGPMVSPVTFRHPSMLAKMAASVSVLSGGRLDLGLGAGWFEGEHRMFGLDYPPYQTRLEMLDEAAHLIRTLWSGELTSFKGKHYRLEGAVNHPVPDPPPAIIMGGKGERTLKVVAKHADEWNFSYMGVEAFRDKSRQLDDNCRAINREPREIRRSLMIPFVIGSDAGAIRHHIAAHRHTFPDLPGTLEDWLAQGYIGGSPQQVLDQMKKFEEAGIQRFMLQQNALDDLDSLQLLASEVLPHFD